MKNNRAKNKYTDRPYLLLVATELARYKSPDKTIGAMRLILEGSVDNSANSNQNLSLLGS